MTILVADDDAGYRYPITCLFQDFKYEVKEASDLGGTVEAARNADIWIIDVRLPSGKMEGIQAVKQLAEQGVLSKYPVIFISVLPESFAESELAALDQHKPSPISYKWIEKGFEPELLLETVRAITTNL